MTDPRLTRYAQLICEHSLGIDESHRLHISTPPEGGPLAVATAREAWRRGARVSVAMAPEWALSDVLRHGSDEQVAYLDPAELERSSASIAGCSCGPPATPPSAPASPASGTPRMHARTRRWMARHDEREAAGELRWVGAAYPTALGAQTARMGTRGVGALRLLRAAARRARSGRRLARAERAPRAPDRAARRRARAARHGAPAPTCASTSRGAPGSPARARRTCPTARSSAAPPLGGVEGEITFDVPSLHDGRECRDVRLRFEAGVVVDASARVRRGRRCSRASTPTRARAAWASSRSARTR